MTLDVTEALSNETNKTDHVPELCFKAFILNFWMNWRYWSYNEPFFKFQKFMVSRACKPKGHMSMALVDLVDLYILQFTHMLCFLAVISW